MTSQAGQTPAPRRRRPRGLLIMALAAAVLTAAAGLALSRSGPPPFRLGLWDIRVLLPAGDAAAAAAQVEAAVQALSRRPVELLWRTHRWQFTLDQLGVQLDGAAMVAGGRVLAGLKRPPDGTVLAAPARVDQAALAGALAPVRAVIEAAPAPARLRVADGEVVVDPDAPGRRLDLPRLLDDLRARLAATGDAETLWAPGDPLPPMQIVLQAAAVPASPTAAELRALGVRRLLARFTTRYDARIPRAENVARAAAALDGLLLRPGEVLSYNAVVGPVDAEHGWHPAKVIVDGRLAEGVGGGVCQTATTLYGAALRAGLEVLERHPHSLPVEYIDPSQDAAVAPGYQDLRLRNTGSAAVLLRATAGEGAVTIEVYGDALAGRHFEVVSEVLERMPPPVREVRDPGLPPGERVVDATGTPGIRSAGYRLLFQDGRLVGKEPLSVDTYPGRPRVIRHG